jgi:pimeloyl-ACP methyl ester carboxylesterase
VRHFGLTYIVQLDLDVCEFWGAEPPPPIENEPVVSSIPTLVLAGEYDPTTPPDYGRLAAQTLAESFFIEFRGYAHGVFSPGCAADVVTAFLDDPTKAPEESCVEELPPLGFL